MSLFDIMGPIMVGPSSSHTAGAVRIGYTARKLVNEEIAFADIYLHGSFLATGKGHGTDKALIAGLLGMKQDDERIPNSLSIADEAGLKYQFSGINLKSAHPNSVLLKLTGESGSKTETMAASTGGGSISINKIDGIDVKISTNYPTLLVNNIDEPGLVSAVTTTLGKDKVNIGTMYIYRDKRGGNAIMTIECDQEVPKEAIRDLQKISGVRKVRYLSMEE